MEITAELIRQNYPAVWWQIFRQGVAEARKDPEFQKQAAQAHLQQTLTQDLPASPGVPLSTPGAARAAVDLEQARAAGRAVQRLREQQQGGHA